MKLGKSSIVLLIILSVCTDAFARRPKYNTDEKSSSSRVNKLQKMLNTIDIPKGWENLINPDTDEFWKEGNHVPDAGFVKLAKNPNSVDDAILYLVRYEIKANRLEKIMKTVEKAQLILLKNGIMKDRYDELAYLEGNLPSYNKVKKSTVPVNFDKGSFKNLSYYFFFEPSCPHCKVLSKNLNGFKNVKPVQLGRAELHHFEGFEKTVRATQRDVNQYIPDGKYPVLLIVNSDAKNKRAIKLKGSKTIGEIMHASVQLKAPKKVKK